MEVKKDILWRVYLCFIGIVVFGLVILGRAAYIQQVQGNTWKKMAMDQQQRIVNIDAERGTIFSEDGSMLSTSIPYFNISIDFKADGLQAKNGKIFKENIDSLCIQLANFYKDKSSKQYRKEIMAGYAKRSRYFPLLKNVPFKEYKVIRTFPLLRLDAYKGGIKTEITNKRLTPFGLLANRTIGLSREYLDAEGKTQTLNVGLEYTYDSVLRGEKGERAERKIAPGVYVPVEGSEIEAEKGKDIITTLDVNIQDIAENALRRVLMENEAEYGTCIVMEVKTGKVKAMANLGRTKDGDYAENLNYAIRATEPGSTFKLATMLALLEDKYITLNSLVDMEGGRWMVNGRTVYDSEPHKPGMVTVKQAFEESSNVAMAKLATAYYSRNPMQFIEHLRTLNFHQPSGIDLKGESTPIIKTPKSRTWSATSLPWMSFGYEVLVSPLQTLTLYNAVANNGKMMKPYLVNEIRKNGVTLRSFEPQMSSRPIASEQTLKLLHDCLYGVCNGEDGTAYSLFKGAPYTVAGKTGTALMANGSRGYADHIYQSSFAGYFPANDPTYSCIVVIRNKPFAKIYYGAKVAGPVFKEVADKLYALQSAQKQLPYYIASKKDSSAYIYAGAMSNMKTVLNTVQWKFIDSSGKEDWGRMYAINGTPVVRAQDVSDKRMPDVRGMGLKDALYLLENMNLQVNVKGKGKVKQQSIEPGSAIDKKAIVAIELN